MKKKRIIISYLSRAVETFPTFPIVYAMQLLIEKLKEEIFTKLIASSLKINLLFFKYDFK